MFRPVVFVSLLVASGLAFGKQEASVLSIESEDFAAQRQQIEADLADGETYAEISSMDRRTVRELLDRIAGRLENAGSVDAMSADQKAQLFNEQEQVNQILTQAAADSRLVCRQEAPTGSRFKKTTCFTVAERRRRMESDQADLRRTQNGLGPANN
ncbi:hypothetical protein [Arenimonas composti]|uniref:Uncharacterized protein n=1 Tax=Arenimonas composti TR7-09 = DSM 18010 TaxID=1121013 RepID=A0A091BET7_9GAMM|nr:hypothetical protein [Arenimonas composti]KFN49324.1 hypothetical protein P873_11155 [Arenimonas composti TR7-09 = DSM 18010]